MSVENVTIIFNIAMQPLEQAESRLGNINQKINQLGSSISNVGRSLTLGLTVPIVGLLGKSAMLASDLKESTNVVNETFKTSAGEVTAWAGTLNESFGMVELESMKYVGSMGAMLTSSGLTEEASKKMSMGMVELTGDMSSFYNLGHEEMWTKIQAGISGETEPLKRLGINMSVANLEAFALSQGIDKSWQSMTQAEQTTLRYNYLMETTAAAQGDFARTSDGFANQLKILQGQFVQIGTTIGEIILPYFLRAVQVVNSIIERFKGLSTSSQKVVIIFSLIVASIGPLLMIIGTLVTMVGGVIGAFSAIGAAISAITLPIAFAVVALTGLVVIWSSIGIAIGVLMAKLGVFKEMFTRVKEVIKTVKDEFVFFKDGLKGIGDPSALTGLSLAFYKLGDTVKTIISTFKEVKSQIISTFGGDAKSAVTDLGAKFKDFALSSVETVVTALQKFGRMIIDNKELIITIISTVVKFGIALVKLGAFMFEVGAKIAKALTGVLSTAKLVFTTTVDIVRAAGSKISEIFASVSNALGIAAAAIDSVIAKTFSNILSVATSVFNSVKTIVSGVGTSIAKTFSTVLSKAKTIFNSVKNTMVSAFKTAKSIITGLISDITGKISTVTSKISDIKSKIPFIGGFATGTNYSPSGMALVGERGPELINLPRGSQVKNNQQTSNMLKNSRVGFDEMNINVSGTISVNSPSGNFNLKRSEVEQIITKSLLNNSNRFI